VFTLLLLELLFFKHAKFVIGGVHAPILNIEIKFGQVEIGADGVDTEDAVALIAAIGNFVCR